MAGEKLEPRLFPAGEAAGEKRCCSGEGEGDGLGVPPAYKGLPTAPVGVEPPHSGLSVMTRFISFPINGLTTCNKEDKN